MSGQQTDLIGVIGVGRMGQAIVRHLGRCGFSSFVFDIGRDQLEAARQLGASIAASPAEVGAKTRMVIIAVGYEEEVTAVTRGDDGLLTTMSDGSLLIVSSTCTPEFVKDLSGACGQKGIEFVDSPICRGAMAADAGTMLAMVGASEAAYERAKPVLGTFCKDIALLGPVGSGQFGKALNNFLLWVNGVALIEAGRLSEANGMDLVKLREALLMSSGSSDALKNWENVSFIWALKDMQIFLKMADRAGLSLPVAGAIKELVKDSLRIKRSSPPDWTGRARRG